MVIPFFSLYLIEQKGFKDWKIVMLDEAIAVFGIIVFTIISKSDKQILIKTV